MATTMAKAILLRSDKRCLGHVRGDTDGEKNMYQIVEQVATSSVPWSTEGFRTYPDIEEVREVGHDGHGNG